MKVINPSTINSANLTSNIPEAAPAEYNAGTTYAINQNAGVTTGTTTLVYRSLQNANTGNTPASEPTWWVYVATTYAEYSAVTTYALADRVINAVTGAPTHHAYESLAAGNLGNLLTDATKWLDLGPTNQLAMFDQINGTATTSSDDIDVSVDVTGRADGVGLFGLTAENVQVTVSTALSGTIYDETYSLISNSGINNWYDYFTEPIVYSEELVLTDIPLNNDPTIRVQITSASGGVLCGTLIIGQTRELGDTVYGFRAGIQDYSKKTVDDFGNYTIVSRPYAKRSTAKVIVENDKIDAVYQLLANLRTTPCVWAATDDRAITWVFGFWKDFVAEITNPLTSEFSLEIEGLT